jgi:hypothetical protein
MQSYSGKLHPRILRNAIFTAVLGLAVLLPHGAQAQSGVGMSPPRVELSAQPGAQLNQSVLIDNPSGLSALQVTASLSDVLLQPDGKMLYLPPGSHPGSPVAWLEVNPLSLVLEPGAAQEVNYTINVPSDAEAGTYWTILFFESEAPDSGRPAEGIGIHTRVRVGHIIYVDVGQVDRTGEIEGFRYQAEGSEPASSIRIMFRNTGNGLVRAAGHVELRAPAGNVLHSLEVSPTATFPGYASEIAALLPEPLESGEYLVLAVLDYGQASVVTGESWLEVP